MIKHFITAIYFQHEGKDKVIYSSNPHHDCIAANEHGKHLLKTLDQIPPNAKNIHYRTYELGAINFLLS